MSLLNDFIRVDGKRPCPVCGKSDWCLISRDNPDDPSRVLCTRLESQRRWKSAGWLHELRKVPRSQWRPRTITLQRYRPRRDDLDELLATGRSKIPAHLLGRLVSELGVTEESLRRLGIGFVDSELSLRCGLERPCNAWALPMYDETGRTIGIRLRLLNGTKLAVPRSRNGLIVPGALSDPIDRLLVAEGESDTAALLDLGFDAIGRPGCTSSVGQVVEFVRARKTSDVVIMADRDQPGLRGAEELARALRLRIESVRVISPPAGIKDARAWKLAGATHADVLAAIEAAPVLALSISTSRAPRG